MKKRSFKDAIILSINTLIAIILVFSYILPFISPKSTPILAVFSLGFPIFFLLNLLFGLYWLIRLKKYVYLPLITLLLGYGYIDDLIRFSQIEILLNSDVKIMSYNVRLFNLYNWKKEKDIPEKISKFIKQKDPSILAIQEYYNRKKVDIDYPYSYIKGRGGKNTFGLAIFSKYPILNSGSLDFQKTANNAIFCDLLIDSDTIRVYNIHLESLSLNPSMKNFGEKNSERLLTRMKFSFKKQAEQVELILKHQESWNKKIIILGDFNNTAFSWVYRKLSEDKKDAFEEAGSGLSGTLNYPFPMRIDFILTDSSMNINSYKNYTVEYSDHFPISARLKLK